MTTNRSGVSSPTRKGLGVFLDSRLRPVGEVANEAEGDHETADERNHDQKKDEDDELALAAPFAAQPFFKQLAHVAERAAKIPDGRHGVVNLGKGVPSRRCDTGEVTPLVGHSERVCPDGEAASQNREDDSHIPEREDRLHHLCSLDWSQCRFGARCEIGHRSVGKPEQNRHRKADSRLDDRRPEDQLVEPAAQGHRVLPRRSDSVAVPDRDQNIQNEDPDEQQQFHVLSLSEPKGSQRTMLIL